MTALLAAFVPYIAALTTAFTQSPESLRDAKSTTVQPKSEAATQPTAEDVLRSLRHRRPVNNVIPPGSRAARDAVAASTKPTVRVLLPEGLSVVGRTGRISHEGQWWIFAVDDDPSLPPIKLLPNTNLELMVVAYREASAPIRFSVSGELTVFEGENFLLPRAASRAADSAAWREPSAAKDSGDKTAPSLRPRPDASAEDVLAAMQAQQPMDAVLPLRAPAFDEEVGTGSADVPSSFLTDGSPLMNRVRRLVRQGSWWTMVSDTNRLEQPDRPLRLLPNQYVERMVRESNFGGGVFIVSGEVTLFEGDAYLLTRAANRSVDIGNLRK